MQYETIYQQKLYTHIIRIGEQLVDNRKTCAVAESCTGGMVGMAMTAVAGSSQWFKGGIIAYCNELKSALLSVDPGILNSAGAVSAETVTAMAVGVIQCTGADYAVSISGIAGPGGGNSQKPVGLVYIGVGRSEKIISFRHTFSGDRENIRSCATMAAVEHLLECI